VTTPVWRRPIWLLGHVIALAAVLAFARLGVWQLDRLEEKRERNEVIAVRMDGPAKDVLDVSPASARYQHVDAHGTFDEAGQVIVPYQSYKGTVGSHVVTPLLLADGTAVLVNRGWVPNDLSAEELDPPSGEVTVEGVLLESQSRRNAVNVGRIQEEYDGELFPLWLSQTAPTAAEDYPVRLDPPARDEGPHRSYAVQWFLFTGVVLVGYPILLRKRMRAEP
jgi:surfeit locus 1 family protein